MTEALLSLDVGTTAVKAVLFDPQGSELFITQHTLTLHTPQPGFVELDPEELWQAVLSVLTETAQQNRARTIRTLVLTTQGGSFLAADRHGRPTTAILTWMDNRSRSVVEEWREQGLEAAIRQICGWSLEAGLPLAMIGWLRAHRPKAFKKSAYFLSVNDFLTNRLTGIYAMNPSMAGEMMLTDIVTGEWSPDLCKIAGIRTEQLSPIRPSDAVLGPILSKVSRETGLRNDTLVVNGGQDHSCEALAIGMTSPGIALLACGTAWVINTASKQADMAAVPPGMNLNFHVIPHCWTLSHYLGGLGGTLEWWINRLWQSPDPQAPLPRARLYALMDEGLAHTHPGSSGLFFFPLGGSRCTPKSLGAGGFWGLCWEHTRASMTRAIQESAACEVRCSLEELKTAGLPMEQLWMIGGAASSPHWPQIVASLTGVDVTLTHYSHGPALGAAILAGVTLGIYPDIEAGRAHFDLKPHCVEPNEADRILYDEHYSRYKQLADSPLCNKI
ncbi:MAG: hypothetical protein IT308_05875 [Anaerolineaceae bacterium]|nr:hypothetical protein [Anaerolineaceae bacterium]